MQVDIWSAAEQVGKQVTSFGDDVAQSNARLVGRIAGLEARLSVLETALDAAAATEPAEKGNAE
jgi:hypothetical protein